MALSYDPESKKWNVSYENTDNETEYSTDNKTTKRIYVATDWVPSGSKGGNYKRVLFSDAPIAKIPGKRWAGTMDIDRDATESSIKEALGVTTSEFIQSFIVLSGSLEETKKKIIEQDTAVNNSYRDLNTSNATTNNSNQVKNTAYDKTVALASNTKGGDYVSQRDTIRNIQGLDDQTKKTLENYYKAFYSTEKLQQWDSALGAKPPYGEFDSSYYKTQSPAAAQQWDSAVANDDIDITQRYGEGGFYLQHYTTQGKPAGIRGNKAETTAAANQYVERAPTDADLQAARTIQLGVDTDTQTDRLLNIPTVASEWEKAKGGDSYWKEQAKEKFLDVNKADEFAALFRLSDRPEDQIVRLNYNANAGYGITELEDALGEAVGEKALVDVKRFGALTQDVLKQTIDEMKKAKAREQNISMFKGFGAFSEISDINKELSNSILGDSGIGGVLSFMGGDKAQESLEKSLTKVTGVNTNNTIYNWQKWFDETLKTKYDENLELGYTTDEAKEQVKIEAGFAKDFVDKYLTPRFNESRSMDEFVEYLDVRQSEQNPFQTQDILNAAKLVADVRAQKYLDDVKATPGRYFDSNFYFSPTGDKAREGAYADQASTVTADWEAAKNGDEYWKSQAYRFGVNIEDKDAFARMHFQVKGQGRGYDPADDILNASKVSDYIYTQILPALKEEALKSGTVFGQFITPDEFADEMLRGLDPNDKSTWDEVLKRYGLETFKGNIEELKDYVKETLRTGSAQEIRENIKYLNEKRQKPTQETLGVTYIERAEDYKDEGIKGETELYKTFQSAGFKGTEDEFYNDFFPDMDRSEQVLLTKSGKDESLKTTGLDFTDPFASLGTIESFFDADEPEKTTDKPEPKTNSYFRIAMGEDEDEPTTKSKSGSAILGEFTSMFKGL
ncbi:hypothetical protein [Synechococcus phage S-EIVl]|nr:hypothetical protein [Synechococcus phage S-EIVl]